VLLAAGCLTATPAVAKTYSADRFDVAIRLLPGGSMDVTETVVFRFEEGTFHSVHREIPQRRTDGIQVVRATMDGRELPFGDAPGHVEVTPKSRLRIRWRFAPLSNSTHTFTLTYRVRGAAYQGADVDVLHWRALPREHDYTIRRSTIEIEAPGLIDGPLLNTHRLQAARVERADGTVRIIAAGIRKNGWVEARLHFARASVVPSAPAWQQRQERADALAPRWIAGAATVGVVGLLTLWALRQGYDAPVRDLPSTIGIAEAPDTLAPAIAGALAANGRVSLEHAMATLFALADRGAIAITEEPRGLVGQRSFALERQRFDRPLAAHEQLALALAFTDKHREQSTTTLSKARSRLMHQSGRFKQALRDEMATAGLLDRDRHHVYARFGAVSLGIIILATAVFIGMAFLVNEYRAWPLLIPGTMMAIGIAGFIFQASVTPLSNEGVRRRERWRAYQKHLKEVAARQAHLPAESPAHLLPLAVALGLASGWAKLVQAHPSRAPAWFHAIGLADDDGAFPALIAAGGAASGGGGGGGGGGAAGGGSSGAS
jgi:hypothetical protein